MTNKRKHARVDSIASITAQHYGGENDLSAIATLLVACKAWEHAGHDTLGSFQRLFLRGNIHHSCLWYDTSGMLHACALFVGTQLSFYVHPQDQEHMLNQQVMTWIQQQARAMVHEQGRPLEIFTRVCAHDSSRLSLLEQYGFRPLSTSLVQMQRPLFEALPDIHLPSDFTIRPLTSEGDITSYLTIFKEVFGVTPSVETVRRQWQEKAFHLHWLFIVHASAEHGVAFGHCTIPTKENALLKRAEGWIEQMGTHPAFRQQGLGYALLVRQLQCLKDVGAQIAILETGSENSISQHLYTSLGFHTISRVLQYSIKVALQ